MENFAEDNGYSIAPESKQTIAQLKPIEFERKPGVLYYDPTGSHLNNKMSCRIDGRRVEAFHYTLWGAGPSKMGSYALTVFEIDIGSQTPHIFLRNKNDHEQIITNRFMPLGKNPRVTLPVPAMHDLFDIIVEQEPEHHVPQILNEDFCKIIQENGHTYSLEFVDHYFHIFYYGIATYDGMLEIVQFIKTIDHELERISSYSEALPTNPEQTQYAKAY
jgi:hypothetical protein